MSVEFNDNYSYLKECQENWKKVSYRAWWFTRAFLEVSQKIDLAKGSLIVSIGSGIGQLEHFLSNRFGYRVICLDVNYFALQAGSISLGNKNSVVANAMSLPFRDQSIDFVLSYDFMEHLPNESAAKAAFTEMERVIKGGDNVRMLHKITVMEEQEAINADKTHHIKWSADKWCSWFEERGCEVREPIRHKIPIWSRNKIGLYPVEGAFYLSKNHLA